MQDNKNDLLYKKIKPQPVNKPNIGADTENTLLQNIMDAVSDASIDMTEINKFTQISQRRDQLYNLLDLMAQDSAISAVLQIYSEDATEYNEEGKVVWATSEDAKINSYINYLLKSLQIDKHIYLWAYSLLKYGDLYVELYKQSEYDLANRLDFNTKQKKALNEDVKLNAYKSNDKYIEYVEAIANPAQLFELTKFGKTEGFIKADTGANILAQDQTTLNNTFVYQYKTGDINIYPATKFVHLCLEEGVDRTTEEVQLFTDSNPDVKPITYKVRRGKSLIQDAFKYWRIVSLLENSIMLNRLTKSSVVRAINVEIGDMPKEDVRQYLLRIKQMFEQKTAVDENNYLQEYTNPGPIENIVYIPTRNGQGQLTTSQIGGDVNIGQLTDLDHFQNKLYGTALNIPKQYLGETDDATGFNGGTSLSIISSRYAKAIKRTQEVLIQGITTIINIFLIDRGLEKYINNFEIRMLPPTTQEELDRQSNVSAKIGIVNDLINIIDNKIDDTTTKLNITKTLISPLINDSNVLSEIDNYLEKLSAEEDTKESDDNEFSFEEEEEPLDLDSSIGLTSSDIGIDNSMSNIEDTFSDQQTPSAEESLPNPEELGVGDLTDSTNPQLQS